MNKKFLLLPIIALGLSTGLFSKGFRFKNNTGNKIAIKIEAETYNDKIENIKEELRKGTVYTNEDLKRIEEFSVTTKGRAEKELTKTWKKDRKAENDESKIKEIIICEKDNGLKIGRSKKKCDKQCKANKK
ncbi:MAG: hypothetical protein ABIF12_02895 [bacterium]